MASETPVHDLQTALTAARLYAVEQLAAKGGTFPPGDLEKLAILQAALTAVNEVSLTVMTPSIAESPPSSSRKSRPAAVIVDGFN